MNNINCINVKFREMWWRANSKALENIVEISREDKKANEKKFNKIINTVKNHFDNFPKEEKRIESWRKKAFKFIDKVIEDEGIFSLGLKEPTIKDGFINNTKSFIKDSREFDNSIDIEEIGQAMRNVWIVNILQALFGDKIKYSKAIFGYSMLYPYTDNYLDSNDIDDDEKKNFNNRFTKRLLGEEVEPLNNHERQVYNLVKEIENVYERKKYSNVYEGLLLIQDGQKLGLSKQHKISIPYENDILGISIDKGGASVVADGYLIRGDMKENELSFCIGYGFLLQLADDLQDIHEDLKNSHITIMSQLAGKYKLDSIAIKLINFTNDLMNDYKFNSGEVEEDVNKLIRNNCLMLILFSIVKSKEYFSDEFIKEIEKYLPFSIEYSEVIEKKVSDSLIKNKSKEELMYMIDKLVE